MKKLLVISLVIAVLSFFGSSSPLVATECDSKDAQDQKKQELKDVKEQKKEVMDEFKEQKKEGKGKSEEEHDHDHEGHEQPK